jgi:hypothetical protein
MRRLVSIVVLGLIIPTLLVAKAAAKINPDNPPPGTFVDDWMIVRMAGADAGWAHSTMTREGDQVTSGMTMHLAVARAGQKIEITISEDTTESVAGEPLAFESRMKLATIETQLSGKIENGKVHISATQLGQTTEQTYDYPQGAKMNWGVMAEELRRGLKPGTEYDVATYVPSIRADGAVNTHVLVQEKETIDLLGRSVEGIRVKQTIESPMMGKLDSLVWLDADGMVLKMVTPLPGIGDLEMLHADEATAKAAGGEAAEMFMNTLIKVDEPIDAKDAQAIRYKLTFTGSKDDAPPEIPRTGMQTPGPWKNRSMELRVCRIDVEKLKKLKPTAPGPGLAEYLAPNVWINNDDPAIIQMAQEAAGDETQPYAVCDRLRRYVTDVIKDKNLSVGVATASEVCRKREGDCTEHAVLLAALGRARGIPSRVVAGIVYVPTFNQADRVFGFHMWTQFYLGGQWVDFDAAQGESDCNPTHIAFAVGSMRDSSMGDFAFPLLRVPGQIKLQVLDTEPIRTGRTG